MRSFGIVALLVCAEGCTPGALKWHELAPARDTGVVTAADLFATADSATRARKPANAANVLVLRSDSVAAAIVIEEMEDIFLVNIYIYNNSSRPYVINPSQFVLMDGVRTAFRPLQPHEAANLFSTRVAAIAPYQPKYTYNVQSSTQGYVSPSGSYAATTQTTVTPQEDPYNALGYTLGAAIAANRNKQFANMAGALYSAGFVEGTSIPAKAGAQGGMYWLKRADWPMPLILRLVQSGREIRFAPSAVPGEPPGAAPAAAMGH